MSKTQVRIDIDGSIATILFHTEDALNVLNAELLRTFHALIARIGKEPTIRTAVIRGLGKVFMAGADIKEMAGFTPQQGRAYAELGQGVFADLGSLPCITIAAINGPAMGGGLELALACDFRIAVRSAKLGFPEVTLGLIPGWGGIGRLAKLIGLSHAKRLYLSGNPVSAEEGLPWGLVDEVVNSSEDLEHRVSAFCKALKKASPSAVALAKRAARAMDDVTAFADCFAHPDAKEGIAAFLQKRPAKWMESG